jgi:hypothetical protein
LNVGQEVKQMINDIQRKTQAKWENC